MVEKFAIYWTETCHSWQALLLWTRHLCVSLMVSCTFDIFFKNSWTSRTRGYILQNGSRERIRYCYLGCDRTLYLNIFQVIPRYLIVQKYVIIHIFIYLLIPFKHVCSFKEFLARHMFTKIFIMCSVHLSIDVEWFCHNAIFIHWPNSSTGPNSMLFLPLRMNINMLSRPNFDLIVYRYNVHCTCWLM